MSIIARIKGGIGNQLFIYSTARRLALANNKELILDHISGFEHDIKYNRKYELDHFNIPCRKANSNERFEPFSRARRIIKKFNNFFLPFDVRDYIKLETNYFDPRIVNLKPKNKLYLEGYFQSEHYFKDFKYQIVKDLKIKPPQDNLNKMIEKKINLNYPAVALHFRFFDQTFSNNKTKEVSNNLSKAYYDEAINRVDSMFPSAHYFIFSDNPKDVRNKISFNEKKMTLVSHNNANNAFADLWLMTKCQHFIIANSTYSWWGAWIANNKNKLVIAPSINKKYSHWKDPKLLPKEWVQL